MRTTLNLLASIALGFAITGGSATAQVQTDVGYGPNPQLVKPDTSLIPTVGVSKAVGWAEGNKPKVAAGLKVNQFAGGFTHPRWLYVLPNGDVLVAESNGPRAEGKTPFNIRDWVRGKLMSRVGAGVPSADRITLLRDADGDGVAEIKTVFLEGLNAPIGMALIGSDLYVGNSGSLVKFPYTEGATSIKDKGTKIVDLPSQPYPHHWVRNILASKDGTKIYVGVGSASNIGERGMQYEENRAAILEVDLATNKSRIFAGGLRNPSGLDWEPVTGKLWTAVNERDELGNDLVPDYITSVQDGAFYGWPYSYFGQNVDERVQPQRPELVSKAIAPDYGMGAHTANLGIHFYQGELLPADYRGGAFVAQHGSWNRKPQAGYRVVYVAFQDGKPTGMPKDILTGFLNDKDEAQGRPVCIVEDKTGALLVTDDVGDVVWRVTPQ